jgi:hypothetical protein
MEPVYFPVKHYPRKHPRGATTEERRRAIAPRRLPSSIDPKAAGYMKR